MKKTDKPTPGTGAPQRKYNTVGPARTPSKTPTGRRPTKPVVKVQPKGAIKKSAVRNPSAPKPVGSGTSVTLLKKAESTMKRDKAAGRNRSGEKMTKTPTKIYSRYTIIPEKGGNKRWVSGRDQTVVGTPKTYDANKKLREDLKAQGKNNKNTKSKGVTPPKKKPEAPKTKGRGGRGGRGGVIGAGGLFGSMFKR